MGRENVLAAGRAFLAASGALMDTCKIERQSGEATNLVTGAVTKNWTTLYNGPCRIQQAAAAWAGPSEVAGAEVRLASSQLQLPVEGTAGLLINDRVTILTAAHDADLVGKVFTITGPNAKSEATTRKFPLLEVLS